MLPGGCFCRFVRYQVVGATFALTSCHCTICRRTSAAAFVTWFSTRRQDLRWQSGQPASFASSSHGRRSFCPRCGTPLTFESTQEPEVVDITTCSLDRPADLPPADDTQVSTRLPWVILDHRLPHYPGKRP